MSLKDSATNYGLVSRGLHWTMALAIFGLFGLGWWMVELTYYSPYYKSAPDLHRSIGIVVLLLLVLRMAWRAGNMKPIDKDLSPFEQRASHWVHRSFYPLILFTCVSGYFISTLDGRSISVFGLFDIPSLAQAKGLEDVAGWIHWGLAYVMVALGLGHGAAAIKHHVSGHSRVLTRMWSGRA